MGRLDRGPMNNSVGLILTITPH
ncbi:uncharacterized protein G2W53_022234 [Senna tora]|uniref:Uncharacterized protein n=1 Tax=Senna tora TaxID=362788 RepID=A0A834WHY7_9FABA|nr:uncharacterized protein G2W53_022234 [Senna tora]